MPVFKLTTYFVTTGFLCFIVIMFYLNAMSISSKVNTMHSQNNLNNTEFVAANTYNVKATEVIKNNIKETISFTYANLIKWVWYVKTNFNHIYAFAKNFIINRDKIGLANIRTSFKLTSFYMIGLSNMKNMLM